jgi:hypothetical protein
MIMVRKDMIDYHLKYGGIYNTLLLVHPVPIQCFDKCIECTPTCPALHGLSEEAY